MTDENSTLRFYKHTNDKDQIGWKTCSDRHVIGPNLHQLFDVLHEHGLRERAHMYRQYGGWSGDLYVVHRRLFRLQNEIARFMGDSGSGGPLVANVYDVTLNSTAGWAQYISLVLRGPYDERVARQLTDLDFAPKHSYLAKNDPVPYTSGHPGGLWLDNPVEFPLVMPED